MIIGNGFLVYSNWNNNFIKKYYRKSKQNIRNIIILCHCVVNSSTRCKVEFSNQPRHFAGQGARVGGGGGMDPLDFARSVNLISTMGRGQIMPTKILLIPPPLFRSSTVPKSARYTNGFFATTYNTQNDHLNPQGLGFENTLQRSHLFYSGKS